MEYWIAALDVPTLLVAGSYLGALSHALMALTPHVGGVPLYPLRRDDAAGLANLTERLLAG